MSAQTNLSVVQAIEAPGQAALTPREQGAQFERAGRKAEAAALYEAVVRTNAAARKVLSRRLVTIYTEIGATNAALEWAREVMQDNPDPQAYLAAVHAQLGLTSEASAILISEIAANTNATRGVILRWQLAEIYEKAGDSLDARRVLREAVDTSKGTALEALARRRLRASERP